MVDASLSSRSRLLVCLGVATLNLSPVGADRVWAQSVRRPAPLVVPEGVERPSLGRIVVPYPHSTAPARVLANVRKIVASIRLDEVAALPELSGPLQVTRILQVRSEEPPPGYLLVELADTSGHPVANFAMTRGGEFIGVENARQGGRGRSLALDDASIRARVRMGEAINAMEYVYFTNTAEPGMSVFRPLVAISTNRGAVYLNSRGEAFVEISSPLATELGAVESSRLARAPQAGLRYALRSVGRW